jgi:tRNA wybutosine-synthesizing protein 4
MLKKRQIVVETPELCSLLGQYETHKDGPILLTSDNYCQIACDLRQLPTLTQSLSTLFGTSECATLFVAEVSITYMGTEYADAVIQWANSIGEC